MLTDLLSVIREGTLAVRFPGNSVKTFGHGEPHIAIRLHDRAAIWQLALNPEIKLGELYMDGRLTIENGDVAGLLDLLMRNQTRKGYGVIPRLADRVRRVLRPIRQFNPARRAKDHVAHHYDLSRELYDLFLGTDRQYSCAYFTNPLETLEQAQAAKKRHIAAKLHIDRPGLKILDIGCGWGGLALDMARDTGARVRGVTLSEEQLAVARDRAMTAGLADRCAFDLVDYRSVQGRFDRIVSVGMFEHVGARYYNAFFAKIRELLADDGVMLLHTIGRTDGPGATNAWIQKYIFPGGYAPALSEIVSAIERAGLIVTDIEVLRMHYAHTLREWRRRFQKNRAEVAKLYDERFCRMWEFYLAGSEMAFRHDGEVVYQIQIAKRMTALPVTRDYMIEQERTMEFAGASEVPNAA
jgi:cyclopropane-fatty-acyl-phospholipid synthase